MVLSSQTPRAGMSRMYMTSKPKSSVKWGWIAVIGIVLVSMYLFVWSGDEAAEPGESGTVPVAVTADTGAVAEATESTRPASVNDLPPPSNLGGREAAAPENEPVVQTIRFGETRDTAAGPPTSGPAGSQLNRGMAMIREGRLVQGRRELSQLLFADDGGLSALDGQAVRDTLASVNKQLVFSDQVTPGDPLAESYLVQRGDYLSVIAPRYDIPYQFIELINNTPAERLQAGKPVKLIKGPFHARISKRDFRIDIYLNDVDGQPVYVRSFAVGLGEQDSTPMGSFVIAPGSKVQNPSWRNPRTGEFFSRNDPKNPIGEYWLALRGTDVQTEALSGYGIHGTIDSSSIGREASMGCVRLRDKDIALLFNMLEPGRSTVHITW
jgi:lipoprotein-anchoring transpeptidase ErfK/SrfK